MDRRTFLQYAAGVLGAGVLGAGCAGAPAASGARPHHGIPYPNQTPFPRQPAPDASPAQPAVHRPAHQPGNIQAISRNSWSQSAAMGNRMRPMGTVRRMTIHHEGNPRANWDTSTSAVVTRLQQIQSSHHTRMKAGDIGYHYIIDRSGRVWQGRSVQFQGAHVAEHNTQNIGVMCLGNFELQHPSAEQLSTLSQLCVALMRGYGLKECDVHCHRDLRNTLCPGRHLYAKVQQMRPDLRRI